MRSTLPSPPPLFDGCICWPDLDGFSAQIPNQNSRPPPRAAVHRWSRRSRPSLTDEGAEGENCIRCLSSRSGDEWESHPLSACIWKPDLSARPQRAALHISPTPLWQHAPDFCRITSAFISSTPHSLPVDFLLLSFTSFNTVSVP